MNKTKLQIFKAAIKSFSIYGYTGTTMDQIAEYAGVAKGTLYYHFKSKEEMFSFIIEEGLNLMIDEVTSEVKAYENPLEKLRVLCKLQLSVLYRDRDFIKIVLSQLWGQEIRQIELRNKVRLYLKQIEGYIKDAMDAGLVRSGNPTFMSYAFFGSLCSAAVYEVINIDKINLDSVIEELIEYSIRGLQN